MMKLTPSFYRIVGLSAILIAVLGVVFFLVLIPLVAGRDSRTAGLLLLAGIAAFGLAVLVLPVLFLYIFLKKPKNGP